MDTDLWERIVQALRVLFPLTTCILLICLTNIYLPNPLLISLMPTLIYPAVWFWLLRRPDLMHFALIFFVGLFSDLLSANLIGVTPFCLLILYRLFDRYERFFMLSPKPLLWLVFTVFVFVSLGLEWLTNSLLYWTVLPPTNFAIKATTTAFVLPIIAAILLPIDRIILGSKERYV